ncbi:AraC family transcriptional regulator [Nocardia sp. NPDC057668]|uniref:AraC family transcriptional regulator n=1 Tax=Nocardia sp. NPDC057668 TaxID=3346202 RepID=UPI003670FF17
MTDLIRGTSLSGFPEVVRDLGGDAGELLRGQGVDPAVVGDHDAFLPFSALARLLGAAAADFDCPDIGLRLAERQSVAILGPVAVIIRHAAHVVDALEGASRYLHTYSPAIRVAVRQGSETAALDIDFEVRGLPHRALVAELSLGVAMDVFHLLLGADFLPLRVTMRHHRGAPAESYRAVFGPQVTFDSGRDAIEFPALLLDREIRDRDDAASALAETHLAPIRHDLALADHVDHLVRRLLEVNRAGLTEAAHAMNMHPRVLQRRLAEQGLTFERILDDVRRAQAWDLAATDLSGGQIATQLGYSEQSSYTRASRRWFGLSPKQLAALRHSTAPADPPPPPPPRADRRAPA